MRHLFSPRDLKTFLFPPNLHHRNNSLLLISFPFLHCLHCNFPSSPLANHHCFTAFCGCIGIGGCLGTLPLLIICLLLQRWASGKVITKVTYTHSIANITVTAEEEVVEEEVVEDEVVGSKCRTIACGIFSIPFVYEWLIVTSCIQPLIQYRK